MTTPARDALRAKINALRAKTTGAGCTEAEALAAAEVAARLMREHGLTEADLVMTHAGAPERTARQTWRDTLDAVIALCTNTACIQRPGTEVIFIGRDPGPVLAVYLREICHRAVRTEVAAFKASTFYRRRRTLRTKRQAVSDFTQGMVLRLSARLSEIFRPMRDQAAASEAMAVRDTRFPATRSVPLRFGETRFDEASNAGWAAGSRVPLNRGVEQEAEPARLLGAGS